jgi:hypothetical protein
MGFSDATRAAVIVTVIAGGLALDQQVTFWGQTLTNAGVWALFLWWLRQGDARQQVCLTACVVYATIGEIFLSLVWGLYDYRLANIPLFVPPGHALLLLLGFIVAGRVKDWIVWAVPLTALPFVLSLVVTGMGTLDGLLFALFLACILFGSARRLYAVMFVLALAMEIYGTWLGNWIWTANVPWLGLTSTNPPLAAGAFYCVLDMLVVTTVLRLRRSSARHIDFMCDQTTNTTAQIKSGAVKAYEVTSRQRVPSLPNLPTLSEAGLKDFEVVVWHGLYVAKGTPKPVLDKLVSSLQAAVKDPGFKEKLAELGAEPVPVAKANPKALQEHLKAEIDKWGPIIKAAGVYAD